MPLVRLLRLQYRRRPIPNPRESALWAVFAISAGWLLVFVLLLLFRHDPLPGPPISDHVSPVGPGDVISQLFVALLAVGPIWVVMRRQQESLASAGVSCDNLGRSLVASILVLSGLLAWWVLVLRRGDPTSLTRFTGTWTLLQSAVVGLAEEFAYRGYLQTRLVSWLGRNRGWVLASVLMATAHVGHRIVVEQLAVGEALISSASLIPVSLFLGYVILCTGSVVAPALLHTMVNWLEL